MSLKLPEVSSLNLPPDYTQITLKKRQHLKDFDLYYEHTLFNEESQDAEIQYSLYRFKFGKGNPYCYLYTDKPQKLTYDWQLIAPLGRDDCFRDGSLLIQPPNNQKIISSIASERNIRLSGNNPIDCWIQILEANFSCPPFLYKLQEPLTAEEIQAIKSWDFDILEQDYFYEGFEKDERIVEAFRPEFITLHDNPYEAENIPQEIQGFNDHSDIIAPTKVGKSSLAEKLGILYTEVSKAGMTGFSTAQETNIGVLDGQYKTVFCDNVHEYPFESLKGLLEARERGIFNIAKGKAPIFGRTTSAIYFILNPPDVREPVLLAQFFIEYIKKQASISSGAVASRTAEVLFLTEAKEVTGQGLPKDAAKKNKLVMEHIREVVNREFKERIFPNNSVQTWLRQQIPENMLLTPIYNFLSKSTATAELKQYWLNIPKSFRHIRTKALKCGVMDNLKSVYLRQYDIGQIINDAEENLNRICGNIVRSLQQLLLVIGQAPREEWLVNRYNQLGLKAKAIVLAASFFAKNHQQIVRKNLSLPLRDLIETYDKLPDELKVSRSYAHFSVVVDNLPNNISKFNRNIREFGIAIAKQGQQNVYTIHFIDEADDLKILATKLESQ